MNIIKAIKSVLAKNTGLICPRCDKSTEGHDEKACERRMSRRYFFGVMASAVAAVGAVGALPRSGVEIARGYREYLIVTSVESGLALDLEEFNGHFIQPHINALCEQIDSDVLAMMGGSKYTLRVGDRISFADAYQK